ncbi:zinc transporter ZupT [Propionibacteriaceae bacterium Y1700]|uniref:zinc transporter ZupT n=1 Tax=Microlunatus sp. Y1700 TaxID=3418487 RepID=UPI003DA79607
MWEALALTVLAGLATSIGGAIGAHGRVHRGGVLALALAFAAGFMITVSLVEILPAGYRELSGQLGTGGAAGALGASAAVGVGLVLLLDRILPPAANPAMLTADPDAADDAHAARQVRLLRSGVLVAVVVAAHNLPEGLATFVTALQDPKVGVTLAVAIGIHNIPEGIAVAAPIRAATGSWSKAFWWATGSGVAEPVGAVIGYVLLAAILPQELITLTLGLVSGMMIAISVRELIPAARHHAGRLLEPIIGLVVGAFVMITSLLLMR